MAFFCAIIVADSKIISAKKSFRLAVEATPFAETAGLKIIVDVA